MDSLRNIHTMLPSVANDSETDFDENSRNRKLLKVLSDEGRLIFECSFFVTLCGFIGVLGTTFNIINIVIFYKQGFTTTVNIAFFCLAISDLSCLIITVWMSICMNPLLPKLGVHWVALELMCVTAGWPGNIFGRITSYITVYITGERCLSIALPLKIKQIVTKTRTTVIMCVIYFVNLITLVIEWATYNLGWRYIPEKNMTLLAAIFNSSRMKVEGSTFLIHSMLSVASFSGVVIFTIILITKLRKSSQLRNEITSCDDHKGSMSARDKRAVKMIVLIASILIACYTPGAAISMASFIVGSEFNINGAYVNICTAIWSIACFFQSINSSVNIFIYYKMSSKYKQTFKDLFKIEILDGKVQVIKLS